MDLTFVTGMAAAVSAVLIFNGSMWLLLSMVMGARLAYFVTASVTLSFMLIMGIVWSINPLGPIGESPEWLPSSIDKESAAPDGYPEGSWNPINKDDTVEATRASELEGAAGDYLEAQINEEKVDEFEAAGDATVKEDSARIREEDGEEVGALVLEPDPIELEAGRIEDRGNLVVVMRYDPGDLLGPPRKITVGILLLFGLHLFGLNRAEQSAKKVLEPEAMA